MSEPNDTSRKPALVGWGITELCNLACPHCGSSATKCSSEELSTTEALWVIDSLGELGTERIGWTGGEPLVRKDLEELVSYARNRYGILSGVTTNGIPLTERRGRTLKEAGVVSIQVSLDGSTAERNQAIRLASQREFERVINAIKVSCDLGFSTHMAMLISAATIDDAHDMLELAKRFGVKSLRFCGFVPAGYGGNPEINRRHDLSGRLDEVRALVEELQSVEEPMVLFDPAFGPLPPDYRFHDCIAGMQMLYIKATGDVHPCTSLLHPDFKIGNLRERTLKEIWNDPMMARMAEIPRTNLSGACRDCEHLDRCHGACRGIAHAATGDLNAPFPNCLACNTSPALYCTDEIE